MGARGAAIRGNAGQEKRGDINIYYIYIYIIIIIIIILSPSKPPFFISMCYASILY